MKKKISFKRKLQLIIHLFTGKLDGVFTVCSVCGSGRIDITEHRLDGLENTTDYLIRIS